MTDSTKPPKVLAVSSSGGHWLNLMEVKDAFEGCEVFYATTIAEYHSYVPDCKFYLLDDISRWDKLKIPFAFLRTFRLLWKLRPDVVISTGALPGLIAVFCARILGAKTIWLDTFANFGRLSLCGKIAGKFVSLWLTQWPHLSKINGPEYKGRIV